MVCRPVAVFIMHNNNETNSFRDFVKAPKVVVCSTCRKSLAEDGSRTCFT